MTPTPRDTSPSSTTTIVVSVSSLGFGCKIDGIIIVSPVIADVLHNHVHVIEVAKRLDLDRTTPCRGGPHALDIIIRRNPVPFHRGCRGHIPEKHGIRSKIITYFLTQRERIIPNKTAQGIKQTTHYYFMQSKKKK